MIVSPTDPRPSRRWRHPALALSLGGLLLLGACAEEALPQRRLSVDDCLTNVQLEKLDKALRRCDRVVAAFPKDPQPLNERFLLHSLKGEEAAACRDIDKAAQLARRIPPAKLDPLLRRDLALRVASCRDTDGQKPQKQEKPEKPAPSPPASPKT